MKCFIHIFLLYFSISLAIADDNLVTVTGQVRKLAESSTGSNSDLPRLMETSLSVLGSVPVVDTSGLIPAVGVEVRFWQPDYPDVYLTATTDDNGNYVIGLGEGVWVGEACGSGHGFYPAAWDLLIENEQLKTMQAVARKNIALEFLHPSNLVVQHESVTLRGSGFGCSGSLLFTYSNSVDRCDIARPVDYQHESIRFDDFNLRTDTELKFDMPELDSDRNVSKHVAFVHYEQGLNKSDRIPIGESVLVSQADNSVLCGGEPVNVETSTAVLAEVIDSASVQVGVTTGPGNPQAGGGYTPDGLTTNDFGLQTHMNSGIQLNNTAVIQVNIDIPGGF
jgi:hypothetical protein